MTRDTPSYSRLEACTKFVGTVRHSMELGIEVLEAEKEFVIARLPWQEKLVGNPATGVIHGGAVFAFLDQVGGLANAALMYPNFEITPTIDFRVDYLHAPEPHKAVMARAECYRLSQHVAFVRLEAWQEDRPDEPAATGLATYMRMKLVRTGGKGG